MKKILLLFLIFNFNGFSQDFQGKAYYMSKTSVNTDFTNNLPPDRAKYILGMMNKALEKNYILDFNSNSSYFEVEEVLEAGGRQGGGFNWMQFVGGPDGGSLHKDLQSKIYTNKKELFGKIFLVKDSITPSKWVMTGETKQIGIYNAYKATITKEVEEREFNFGRRPTSGGESESEPEAPKMREVVMSAWFTPEIPVSTGPAMYGGLPGLILEINDDKTIILCTKVVLNPKVKIKIKAPSKGKVVTKSEFDQIAKDKAKEMQEMYQGRRGGRSRVLIRH
ncbi:MAG TPA: GLPGLI family protein [Flavobacteriaceae bacterium]|jgi:GLPGLI family protein|nr:GLPGLI family protein [Flavobacteriaceae bacterium]